MSRFNKNLLPIDRKLKKGDVIIRTIPNDDSNIKVGTRFVISGSDTFANSIYYYFIEQNASVFTDDFLKIHFMLEGENNLV